MEYSEQVIILKIGKFKETDIWVRFLSPSRGVLSGFAFGGSRSRKRFVGCLDIFNSVLFHFHYNSLRNLITLKEGVLLRGLVRLRSDWQRFGMLTNCAKFLDGFGITPEGSSKAYSLFEELLLLLEEEEELLPLLPGLFRLRLANEQGYKLTLNHCNACGAHLHEKNFIEIHSGQLLCPLCARLERGKTLVFHRNSANALIYFLREPLQSWKRILFTPEMRFECARFIDSFIQYHIGLTWENGRFVRS